MTRFFECFISDSIQYALLDDDGHIRATSHDIIGIAEARKHFGWGNIHKIKMRGKTIIIGGKL